MGKWGDWYKILAGSIELASCLTTARVAHELWTNKSSWSVGCLLHLPLILFTFLFNISYLVANILFLLDFDESLTCESIGVELLTYVSMYAAASLMPTIIGVVFVPYYSIRKARSLERITTDTVGWSFFITTCCTTMIFFAMYLSQFGGDVRIMHYGGDLFCAFDHYTIFYLIIGEIVPLAIFIGIMYFLYKKHIIEMNFDGEIGFVDTVEMNRQLEKKRRSMRSASSASRKRSRSRFGSVFGSRERSQSRSSGAGIKSPPVAATPSLDRPRTSSITMPMVKHIRRTSSANNKVVDIVTTDVGLRESSWRDAHFSQRGSVLVDPQTPQTSANSYLAADDPHLEEVESLETMGDMTTIRSIDSDDMATGVGVRPYTQYSHRMRISIQEKDGPPQDVDLMSKLGTDTSFASYSSKTDTIRTDTGFTLPKIDTSRTDTANLGFESDITNTNSFRKSSYSMADSPKPSLISLGSAEAPDELPPMRVSHSMTIRGGLKQFQKTSSELEGVFTAFNAFWRHMLIVWTFVFFVNIGLFILCSLCIAEVDERITDKLFFVGGTSFKMCNILACWVFFQNATMKKEDRYLCPSFCICSIPFINLDSSEANYSDSEKEDDSAKRMPDSPIIPNTYKE